VFEEAAALVSMRLLRDGGVVVGAELGDAAGVIAPQQPTTRRVKCTIVRRGESSCNERSAELHFQHQENRIGAKLPIELVVHRDPIFVYDNKARETFQSLTQR
jgi:hypothetical protein